MAQVTACGSEGGDEGTGDTGLDVSPDGGGDVHIENHSVGHVAQCCIRIDRNNASLNVDIPGEAVVGIAEDKGACTQLGDGTA